jgi:hypothetical protein
MTPKDTLRALLAEAIDYAGLFPPARLPMEAAAVRYAEYLEGPHAWALGRFVVPAARLDELLAARGAQGGSPGSWRLSVILGTAALKDTATVRRFNEAHGGAACIDSVEMKIGGNATLAPKELSDVVAALPSNTRLFVELSPGPGLRQLLQSVRSAGANAKIRTGGVTPDAFPSPIEVADFLLMCAEECVSFKATAGLHHPCRGKYPLTYEAGSARGTMFGFLNVLIAAAFARSGVAKNEIVRILEAEQADAFCFGHDEITWCGARVSGAQIVEARNRFVLSFGSCSFEEPIQELRGLSLL